MTIKAYLCLYENMKKRRTKVRR